VGITPFLRLVSNSSAVISVGLLYCHQKFPGQDVRGGSQSGLLGRTLLTQVRVGRVILVALDGTLPDRRGFPFAVQLRSTCTVSRYSLTWSSEVYDIARTA